MAHLAPEQSRTTLHGPMLITSVSHGQPSDEKNTLNSPFAALLAPSRKVEEEVQPLLGWV